MANNRIARTNDDIQRVLSELLRSVKDPRVQQGMQDEKEFRRGLKSASGWLRRELAKSLSLRYTPELVFELDHSIEYGAHISSLLNELDIRPDEEAGDEEQ